jgi:hypothetical protein
MSINYSLGGVQKGFKECERTNLITKMQYSSKEKIVMTITITGNIGNNLVAFGCKTDQGFPEISSSQIPAKIPCPCEL